MKKEEAMSTKKSNQELLRDLCASMGVVVGALIVMALHWAQDVFVPLVLAGLLCFLLAPLVNVLERRRIPRMPAVLLTTVCAFAAIGLLASVVANQMVNLAYSLPSYQENMRTKISSLKFSENEGPWGRLSKMLEELRDEATRGGSMLSKVVSGENAGAQEPGVTPVRLVNSGTGIADVLERVAMPVLGPLGTGAVVVIFVIFMLLKKEDLRNRVIHLAGRSRLSLTTRALEEAGERVSKYLLMQLVVNVSYGVPIAIGLAIIGVPNAMLWGVLTTVLRFIPYVGPWIGAAFPVALSLAVSDSWATPLYTIGLFLVMELISNNVIEPWLYGSSTGLSPVAILVAAIFWTWLWGPVGLLLATPLTVCLAVLGKHVPSLGFLDILLGDEPTLPAADRYYQRLLAHDAAESRHILEEQAAKVGRDAALTELVARAVLVAEGDKGGEHLDEAAFTKLVTMAREQALTLGDEKTRGTGGKSPPETEEPQVAVEEKPDVLILGADDEGDETLGVILTELLHTGLRVRVLPGTMLASDKAAVARNCGAAVVCISDASREGAPRARYLARKIRDLGFDGYVVMGLWSLALPQEQLPELEDRFHADEVVGDLLTARKAIQGWALPQVDSHRLAGKQAA